MYYSSLALLSSALVLPALAFHATSPLLVFNSHPSQQFHDAAIELAGSGMADADRVYGKLAGLGCDWQSAVVVHVDSLHNSHLADHRVPNDAHVHIPYLTKPNRRSLDSSVESWAASCGASVVDALDKVDGKSLVQIYVAPGELIPELPSLPTPSIVIVTGTHSQMHKRQEEPEFPFPSTSTLPTTSDADPYPSSTTTSSPHHNNTIPTDGPLLDRVQILTTPIISALLITFGIFIPLSAFAISSLAGIQVPPRMMEIGKGLVVGKDRKDQ